jgi:DNA-directed RNA polymerase specialized sigma24 family protein
MISEYSENIAQSLHTQYLYKEMRTILLKTMSETLKNETISAICFYFYGDLNTKQISKKLKTSELGIKARLTRALNNLKRTERLKGFIEQLYIN